MNYRDVREKGMKVFISWSGECSNKIAEVLKHWTKSVIQSLEPFVSSEDISKGSRWSADIAKELQDTDFGILCVTKDNFQQPWLLFEAGALSKTLDKAYVVPLLFDLGPSDLPDSPLLQFQAASFSKSEIKKLIDSMNSASEKKLDASDLSKAFDVWYPELEKALSDIPQNRDDTSEIKGTGISEKSSIILEEVLVLSRENQKLLRNPEGRSVGELEQINKKLDRLHHQSDKNSDYLRKKRQISPMMMEELMHFCRREMGAEQGLLFALAFFREDYPWLYELGRDLLDVLKADGTSVSVK